jgi:AmmeMemoRadiSam system protein B
MNVVRPAAVSGLFYPDQPAELHTLLNGLLSGAKRWAPDESLKILIVPHAGYVYSGSVAAAAYLQLSAQRRRIKRVVLLGPTHRVAVRGAAIPAASAFATPLGVVELDHEALERLARHPGVVVSEAAHAAEHSLEVQVPFLQTVLDHFTLVPLAVGNIDDTWLAAVLDEIWGGEETIIIISSDLSHYHPYREAREIDRITVERILALEPGLDHGQACGATPINAALDIARRRGLRPRLLAMCNSGDTAGDRNQVVGYCAIAFERSNDELQ